MEQQVKAVSGHGVRRLRKLCNEITAEESGVEALKSNTTKLDTDDAGSYAVLASYFKLYHDLVKGKGTLSEFKARILAINLHRQFQAILATPLAKDKLQGAFNDSPNLFSPDRRLMMDSKIRLVERDIKRRGRRRPFSTSSS